MKKTVRLLTLLLALSLAFGSTFVFAADLWKEDYYRAYDDTGEMTEEQRNDLDGRCIAFMEKNHVDMVVFAITPESYEGETLADWAKGNYDAMHFGYGEKRDGVFFLYDAESKKAYSFAYGPRANRIPQEYLDAAVDAMPTFEEEYGVWGALYSGVLYLADDLDKHPLDEASEQGGERDLSAASQAIERVGADSSLPSWYPADVHDFPFYHDEEAPRVVDDADIFTDAEEQALEARIRELRTELERDLVVYTDTSDYGLGKDICAADFYDFNGYGYGEEREGMCLFIDMDPYDRGFWTCGTGSETMGLHTYETQNSLDDALYEYMAAGDYAAGVADWLENVRTMYVKGFPFAPDWYPDEQTRTSFVRTHNTSASRVVDDAELLTGDEIEKLEEQAAQIAEKYGLDVAIYTSKTNGGMSAADFSDLYYYYNGYGFGDDYDGILLSVFKEPGYYAYCRMTASGKGAEKLSDVNRERLTDACRDTMEDYKYYDAMSQWLGRVDHMEKTGRVPQSIGHWIAVVLGGLFGGSLVGGIALGGAKKKMAPPKTKADADRYVRQDISRVQTGETRFLYTTSSRRYSPVKSDSGGRSGGGGGHSYSGSSGSSHSGSGRSF